MWMWAWGGKRNGGQRRAQSCHLNLREAGLAPSCFLHHHQLPGHNPAVFPVAADGLTAGSVLASRCSGPAELLFLALPSAPDSHLSGSGGPVLSPVLCSVWEEATTQSRPTGLARLSRQKGDVRFRLSDTPKLVRKLAPGLPASASPKLSLCREALRPLPPYPGPRPSLSWPTSPSSPPWVFLLLCVLSLGTRDRGFVAASLLWEQGRVITWGPPSAREPRSPAPHLSPAEEGSSSHGP